MADSGSALRLVAICLIESVLASFLFAIAVGYFTGLINRRFLSNAISSVAYPQHQPMDVTESSGNESLQLALNMEIFGLVTISISLSLLLCLAIRWKSAEHFRIWVLIQVVMTVVISFPLVYQFSSLTHWKSSMPPEYRNIIMLLWVVWISYRFISILIVADELKWLASKGINEKSEKCLCQC